MPEVQQALQAGRLIVSLGTTNAYVAEELTGRPVDKGTFTAGMIASGVLCVSDPTTRQSPICFVDGQQTDRPWLEVLSEFTADDVFIKGANALDLQGNAGVLLGGKQGGTIGQAMGALSAVGAHLIIPVGLEKLIPDVPSASMAMGQGKVSGQWGMPCGLYVVSTGEIVTEADALQMLFDVGAIVVAAGGVAGSEGAITLAVQGEDDALSQVDDLMCQLKREPSFIVNRG